MLDVYSKRYMNKAEMINRILKFGNPLIIASDVNAIPKSVEKIASKFACISYSPAISMSLKEKHELTKEFTDLLKNDHEVDALSASIKAWKHYRHLFFKVNEVLNKFNKPEIFGEVIKKVVRNESSNIEDFVRKYLQENENKQTKNFEKKNGEDELKLQQKLAEKQKEIDNLRYQTELLSKALNEMRKKFASLRRIKFPKKAEARIRQNETVEYLKKLRKVENRGYYPLIEIDEINIDILDKINDEIDLENRIIFSYDKENLTLLNSFNIKCVLLPFTIEKDLVEKLEFPIITLNNELIEEMENIRVVKKDYIEKEIAHARRTGLIKWLENYKKRKL